MLLIYTNAICSAEKVALSAMSGLFPPNDCPTNIDTVIPIPIKGIKESMLIFKAIFEAANSGVPSLPMSRMKIEKAAMSRENWIPFGIPNLISLKNNSLSKRYPEIVLNLALFFPERAIYKSIIKLHSSDMIVASPAPPIPISGNPSFPKISI